MSDIKTPTLSISTADTELVKDILESLGEDTDTVYFQDFWDNASLGYFRVVKVQRIDNAFWVFYSGVDVI